MAGIRTQVDDPDRVVLRKYFGPALAAVDGPEDSAVRGLRRCRKWPPKQPDPERVSSGHDDVRVLRIDDDGLDEGHVLQSRAPPLGARVCRTIDTIASRLFSGSDVENIRIGRSHCERTNRSDPLLVENR